MNKATEKFMEALKAHGIVDAIELSVNMNPPPSVIPADLVKTLLRDVAIHAITDAAKSDKEFSDVMAEAAFECLFDEVFKAVPLTRNPDFKPTPEQLARHDRAKAKAERMTKALFAPDAVGDLLKAILS